MILSLFLSLVLVLDDPVFERAPAGGLLVTCRAIGFPPILTVNLDPSSDFISNPRETPVFESIVRNTYSFSECDPTTNYQCSAVTMSGQDSSTSGQPPEELCSCECVCVLKAMGSRQLGREPTTQYHHTILFLDQLKSFILIMLTTILRMSVQNLVGNNIINVITKTVTEIHRLVYVK